jgi:hypothetical protein
MFDLIEMNERMKRSWCGAARSMGPEPVSTSTMVSVEAATSLETSL